MWLAAVSSDADYCSQKSRAGLTLSQSAPQAPQGADAGNEQETFFFFPQAPVCLRAEAEVNNRCRATAKAFE